MALRNDDFRSLLQKGSTADAPSGAKGTDRLSTGSPANAPKKKKERVWVKKSKPEDSSSAQEPKDVHAKYRDRALERRKNVTTDNNDVDEATALKMDADMTKYLGGDEAHTHLVKGLDLALLRKTREDMEKSQRIAAQMLSGFAVDGSVLASAGQTGPVIRTQLAKDIFSLVKQHAADFRAKQQEQAVAVPVTSRSWFKSHGTEKFLPGRMLYQFDLTVGGPELPKVILVPKEDCPHTDDCVGYKLDDMLMGKLVNSLHVQAQRRKHKVHGDVRHEDIVVSPRQPALSGEVNQLTAVDDGSDVDMFGDASDDGMPVPKPRPTPTAVPTSTPVDVTIDESEAFDPVPARFRAAVASSTRLPDADVEEGGDVVPVKPSSVGAVLAGSLPTASALADLLSDDEEDGTFKRPTTSTGIRKQVRVTSAKTLEAVKQRLKKKLDAPDEGEADEFEASHSIAVVESDEEAEDRETDRDKWLVRQKALEMKETLAATAAVAKKLDREKQRRLKDAANLGVGGLGPLSAEEKAGANANPEAAKQAAKKQAEKEKRKLDTSLQKIDKLIEQRKEKRSRGEDVQGPPQ